MREHITSFQNPRIKLVKKLRDKRGRDRENRFVIDYRRDLERALSCGLSPDFVLICPELCPTLPQGLTEDLCYEVPRALVEKISYRENSDGLVAVVWQRPPRSAADLNTLQAERLLVLVGLDKPGNIGALLRTADAAGFRAVLLVDIALDLWNPNIIRSSTGACFVDRLFMLTSSEAQAFLKTGGYRSFAAHPDSTQTAFETDLSGRTALVLGAEDRGLPQSWRERCDTLLRIPMVGQITDSLNVSVAGAVLMYEVLRQSGG